MQKSWYLRFLAIPLLLAFSFQMKAANAEITLEDIWKNRTFVPKSIHLGKSMLDGEHYTMIEDRYALNVYAYNTGEFVRTIINVEGMIEDSEGNTPRIDDYFFCPREEMLLLAFNTESIYRYSSQSDFYVYELATSQLTALSENGKQRLPDFSPDGNHIAFVRNNNIYIKDLSSGTENRITHDGEKNHIINGTTDWVYEEEFGFTKGFQWSPDGARIAFYRFDESHVKEFNMLMYGSLYPNEYRFKYPKAGEENALVGIHLYEMATGTVTSVDVGQETDQYIPRIKWTQNPHQLAVFRLNRHQNYLEILLADAPGGQTRLMYEEKNKYYVAINDDLTFLEDGQSYILTSEKDGFKHIYHYAMNGELIRQVTRGDWDVNRFLGIDEETQHLFFTSFEESPMENHLYYIGLDGSGKTKLTQEAGYHVPRFSQYFRYYLNNYTTINTPPVYSIYTREGDLVRVLEDNEELLQKTRDAGYVQAEFFTVPIPEGEYLNAWIMKPAQFDPAQKYPVFMYVYGGPGSQTVTHRWNAFNGAWFQMLTQMGYIVVSVDNRGTGGRGEEFKKMTYLQLGKYETIDQIEAAKQLAGRAYVDENNISIFGWSYGGYLSSLCLALGADVFSAAIAVAPVTTWRFYDTIYTERYMRTPAENPDGYDDNSPINHVEKIKGDFLLVHGSADDNVHYQNAIEMARALIDNNVDFEMMIYPNDNHSIVGNNSRLHLYRLMTDFLERSRKKNSTEEI